MIDKYEKKVINFNLSELLAPWIPNLPSVSLKEITLDSRLVKSGDLFFAIIGHKKDGRQYIHQAIKKGVAAIIAETEYEEENGKVYKIQNVPIVYFFHLKKYLSMLSGRFYREPSNDLCIVGITGTNGKTTTAHLIAQWSASLDERSAIMGTMGNGLLNKIIPAKNTTSSAVEIQSMLSNFLKKKVALVAMEVSSHSLVQHRVEALKFSASVFTNISHDHLDYHRSFKKYKDAKWLLYSSHHFGKAIINADDKIGLNWLKKIQNATAVSIENSNNLDFYKNWIKAVKIKYYDNQTIIYFSSSWGEGRIKSPLIGMFNVSNLLLAMATMLTLGYPIDKLLSSSTELQPVCGRMEAFKAPGKPTVFVDYAHTPDALEKALKVARTYCKGKLWCIFGCGGDRDKNKRSLMGALAEQFADILIVTNDNPRYEEPYAIINDILSGMLNVKKAHIIENRAEAVRSAILKAKKNDIILLAGKGHENYQIIGMHRLNYSDRMITAHLLKL